MKNCDKGPSCISAAGGLSSFSRVPSPENNIIIKLGVIETGDEVLSPTV